MSNVNNQGTQVRSRLIGRRIICALFLTLVALFAALGGPIGGQSKLGITTGDTTVQLQLHGLQSDQVYQIEASTNLQNWAIIGQRAASNGMVSVTDPQSTRYPRRYYKAVAATQLTAQGNHNYATDKILVKPKLGVSLGSLNLSLGTTVLSVFPAIGNLQVVKVPASTTADTMIALYLQSGLVQYAEPDFNVHVLATPNDPFYSYLWGFHNTAQFGGVTNDDIDAQDAWNVQNSASNIIIAVVDTGIRYTHQDLAANMWVNPVDGSHGTNAVANGRAQNDPWDDYGHGTHCAGIMGAVGNNALGVVGVAWKVQIMACKFLDTNGNGTIDGAISCMDFARAHGANVVNASWGATTFTSQALHDAIASLGNAGIMFVAAAGNSSADNDVQPLYPASYSDLNNVISVAASDESDQLASFSDYGATNVDLAAPGTLIYSCWNSSDSDYQYLDGTSMACALMSGAVAVMEAHFPGESYSQIKQQIMANVDTRPGLQGKCISGGRLNLYKALTGGSAPPPITASFSPNPSGGQAPLAVQFTDTSTGNPVSWSWNFGDGGTSTAQNPSYTFTNAGSFNVTLTVANSAGQTSSASQAITVGSTTNTNGAPVLSLAAQADAYVNGQVPGVVNFHRTGDTSQAYQIYWSFSGTASNGVDYGPLPTNSPFPSGQSDAALTITPINHGQTNDETVVVTLMPGPNYQIGQSNTAVITIHGLQPGPTASFTANPTSGQAPLTVQFADTSTGNVVSWNWNFGDGSTNTAQNPSHTFSGTGSFTVTLTVANSSNQTSSASQVITVTNAAQSVSAAFAANPSSGQTPLAVNFTDQSSGPVTSWNWSFGDGASSTSQNPSHTYTSAGTFTTTLTVTGSSGQTSSANHVITVTNAAQSVSAAFAANPSSGQAPLAVNFTDQSSGPVTSWSWNFGDGASSTSQNPSHTYAAAGNFTATLTVSGSNGQTSSASQTITVTNAAQSVSAAFAANPANGQAPLAVNFTDQSSGPVTSWSWNFGDGASSTSQNPSHTYATAGDYTATLTVAGSSGQTGSASHVITVTNAPQPVSAAFSANPSSGQAPLAVSFTDESSGPVTSWSWNFGDGASSTSQNPSHTYVTAGNYTATLTVAGSGGQTSIVNHVITVTNAPQPVSAAFAVNPSSGKAPLAVNFTDQSSGPVTSWSWNFGDSSTSSSQNPSHTYAAAGSFTATLTVRGGNGQTSSASHVITVTNAPQPVSAAFAANPSSGQAPLAVSFTDQSSGPVTSWSWNFGDGASSASQNPSHTYATAGNYTATLTVAGSSGQTSSVSHTITVTSPPPPLATVTVEATQPLATSITPGVFSVSRTGSTGSDLTVNYSLGGSAQNGVSYQTLSGTVTIPAGSSTATVVVNPLGLLNILQTVVLTVSPEPAYSVGSESSATVEIVASLGL